MKVFVNHGLRQIRRLLAVIKLITQVDVSWRQAKATHEEERLRSRVSMTGRVLSRYFRRMYYISVRRRVG